MSFQDILAISLLAFFALGALVMNVLSDTDWVSNIYRKVTFKYRDVLNYDSNHPMLYDNDLGIYSIYGVEYPDKPIKSLLGRQKYVGKVLKKELDRLGVSVSLKEFTGLFLKVNDNVTNYDYRRFNYYHFDARSKIIRSMLTVEQVAFFVNGDYNMDKIAALYRRGLDFDNIVEAYSMPLEWVDKLYDVSDVPQFRPMSRF